MTTTRTLETLKTFETLKAERFIEEGAAFSELAGATASSRNASGPERPIAHSKRDRQRFQVIVIGGGQAGLSVGYHLARRGIDFVILDAHERIGDSWRKRWDSLRLFTPARFDSLDGMPFPAPPNSFPTKEQMADYLAAYAARFELPVRSNAKVERLSRDGQHYVVETADAVFEADHVVVAMANFQARRVPAFAPELAPGIVQLHSTEYKNPSQLKEGAVLIAGVGNSGAEIALDLARQRHTWVSGRDTGHVPFRVEGFWARLFLLRLVLRVFFHRLMTVRTPMGRKLRKKMLTQGGPLVRTKPIDLLTAGVERVPRTVGVRDGLPLLADGRVLDVANVIWCTGYDPGLSWIDLPILDSNGEPRHEYGLANGEPGLYFVGRMFVYAASSVMVHGVGRDAARIASVIATRTAAARATAPVSLAAAQ